MGFWDIVWLSLFIGGALYLLYRGLWKKKGHCQGCCDSTTCTTKK